MRASILAVLLAASMLGGTVRAPEAPDAGRSNAAFAKSGDGHSRLAQARLDPVALPAALRLPAPVLGAAAIAFAARPVVLVLRVAARGARAPPAALPV